MLPAPCRLSLFLVLAMALSIPASAHRRETGFLDRTVTVNNIAYKYQVYVPDNWSPNRKWPVILFLHGAVERGSDGLLQTQVGIATAIRKDRSRFRVLVVMPQCPSGHWWPERPMQRIALEELAASTEEFKGDPKRTYLTGVSMGGYGSWYLASTYPGKFAAVVPICGGIVPPANVLEAQPMLARDSYPENAESYAEVAKRIGKTPVWIFHGDADNAVPVENSRRLYKALKAAGDDVRYTEYPGVGHDEAWERAYADPELLSWLCSKSL
jgi:predicted peptidase